eukprot:1263709-Prymnesium_polylepis.1
MRCCLCSASTASSASMMRPASEHTSKGVCRCAAPVRVGGTRKPSCACELGRCVEACAGERPTHVALHADRTRPHAAEAPDVVRCVLE